MVSILGVLASLMQLVPNRPDPAAVDVPLIPVAQLGPVVLERADRVVFDDGRAVGAAVLVHSEVEENAERDHGRVGTGRGRPLPVQPAFHHLRVAVPHHVASYADDWLARPCCKDLLDMASILGGSCVAQLAWTTDVVVQHVLKRDLHSLLLAGNLARVDALFELVPVLVCSAAGLVHGPRTVAADGDSNIFGRAPNAALGDEFGETSWRYS